MLWGHFLLSKRILCLNGSGGASLHTLSAVPSSFSAVVYAGLSPVDPLEYCSDIILGNVPDARRWTVKDIRQAFRQDRPLTPDEYAALLAKYKPPEPVAQQQQQPPQQAQLQQPAEPSENRRRGKEVSSR